MKYLFVIPARGGSKGIPGKNIKPLNGKPLIHYSIEYARAFTSDEHICLSTDSKEIADCARAIQYEIPFTRPAELSTDTASSFDVLLHIMQFYKQAEKNYDAVVLLQPTSPFREKHHLEEALKLFNNDIDMVVSVKIAAANPYFNLFEENDKGFLHVSKGNGEYSRRQDAPPVYEYNGSIYVINTAALQKHSSFSGFKKIVKYVMPDEYSIDLDTPADWKYAEYIAAEGNK